MSVRLAWDDGREKTSSSIPTGGALYFDDRGSSEVHLEGGTPTSAAETFDPRNGSFSLVSNLVVAIAAR